jgi:hypothetical protein
MNTLILRFSLLGALTCALIACQSSTSAPETQGTVERNVELAKKAFATFNAHDWAAHANCFSESCKNLDPSLGSDYVVLDHKEKVAKYEKLNQWSPDIKDSITNIFGAGDKVLVQFISSGTARMDSTDQKWSLPICTVFTIKEGLIVMDETYYDK